MKKLLLTLIVLTAFFIGCDFSCDDEKNDIRNQYGEPEEISSYSSGGYTSTDWWYWSKGIEFTFTEQRSELCEVSTYTFSPIYKLSEDKKKEVCATKVLVNKQQSNNCPTCP